jgi:hypothetical protein
MRNYATDPCRLPLATQQQTNSQKDVDRPTSAGSHCIGHWSILDFLIQDATVWNVKLGSTHAVQVSTVVMFQRAGVRLSPFDTSVTI